MPVKSGRLSRHRTVYRLASERDPPWMSSWTPHPHTRGLLMLWPDTTTRSASGELAVGGIPATVLAAEFGTPLYVFDEVTLRSRAERIVRAFRDRSRPVPGRLRRQGVPVAGDRRKSSGVRDRPRCCLRRRDLGRPEGGHRPARAWSSMATTRREAELALAVEHGVGTIVVDNNDEVALLDRIAASRYGSRRRGRDEGTRRVAVEPGSRCAYSRQDQHRNHGFQVWHTGLGRRRGGARLSASSPASTSSWRAFTCISAHRSSTTTRCRPRSSGRSPSRR